jgi:hypothetical protein
MAQAALECRDGNDEERLWAAKNRPDPAASIGLSRRVITLRTSVAITASTTARALRTAVRWE